MNKGLGTLLTLCVLFAVLRMAAVALALALGLALLVALITRPRETLSFLGTLGLVILANAHPLACIITLGVVGVAVVAAGALRKGRHPLALTDGREGRPPDAKRLNLLG
jgi:hypothetical protein